MTVANQLAELGAQPRARPVTRPRAATERAPCGWPAPSAREPRPPGHSRGHGQLSGRPAGPAPGVAGTARCLPGQSARPGPGRGPPPVTSSTAGAQEPSITAPCDLDEAELRLAAYQTPSCGGGPPPERTARQAMRCDVPAPGVTGTIDADGYCDICGAQVAPPRRATAGRPWCDGRHAGTLDDGARRDRRPSHRPGDPSAAPPAPQNPSSPAPAPPPPAPRPRLDPGPPGERSPRPPAATGTRRGTRSTGEARPAGATWAPVWSTCRRSSTATRQSVLMPDPHVSESKRYCAHCDAPVGRSRDGRPGRAEGFCRIVRGAVTLHTQD